MVDENGEIANLKEGLTRTPGNVDFIHRLVRLLLEERRKDEALEVLDAGIWECLERGRYKSALDLMQKRLIVDPEGIETNIEIGKTHLQMGRFHQAIMSFGEAFDGYLGRGEFSRAQKILERMLRVEPEGTEGKLREAQLYVAYGERDRALKVLQKTLERLEREGQRQEFLVVGERILELQPDFPELSVKMGENLIAEARAFVNYGLYDQAVKALCRAVKYTPNQVDTHITLAEVLVVAGRRDEAMEMAFCALRQVQHDEARRELLMWLRETGFDQRQVEEYAANLGIDLERDGPQGHWPFGEPDEEEGGLHEETSPVFDLQEVGSEVLGVVGPVLDSESAVENGLRLLKWVEDCDEEGLVGLVGPEGSGLRAEFRVKGGRILGALLFNGEVWIDEKYRVEAPELVAKLTTDTGANDDRPVITMQEKRVLGQATAAALGALCGKAAATPLETVFFHREFEQTGPSLPSFTPATLLMELGKMLTEDRREETAAMRKMGEEIGESFWILSLGARADGFMPREFYGNHRETTDEILVARRLAMEIYEASEKASMRSGDPWREYCFLFDDGAWTGVCRGKTVYLLRTERNQVGRLLRFLSNRPREALS